MPWIKLIVIGLLILGVVSCSKEESPSPEAQTVPFAHPPQGLPAETPAISGTAPAEIPDGVKDRWKAVKLLIEDKQSNSSMEYTVELGSELVVPDSNIVVKVQEFLPDLKIEGNTFTTASAELLFQRWLGFPQEGIGEWPGGVQRMVVPTLSGCSPLPARTV